MTAALASPASIHAVMQDPRLNLVLAMLLVALMIGVHLTRTGPAARRQWRWVWVTVVFLLWLLGGLGALRACPLSVIR
jgi:uncharacterized membrane protein